MSLFTTFPREEHVTSDAERPRSLPKAWNNWSSERWWNKLATAPQSILMVDYDGTLAPFVSQRMHAAPYPGVFSRLLQMLHQPKIRLIVLSGRPARELASLLPDLTVEIWGDNGRERLLPDGGHEIVPLTHYQAGALTWLESSFKAKGFSSVIEYKPGSLALHTRGRRPQVERQLVELIPALFRQLSHETALEWLPFDGGFEVRATGCSTAEVVNCVLNEEKIEGEVAYLGDDIADEAAFRALDGRGLRVLVRNEPRNTLADVWLSPPKELLEFLDRWLEATA